VKSLLDQLPKIVADGKREAEQILERLEGNFRIGLQTRELVVPSRDTNWQDFLVEAQRSKANLDPARMNRLIYGDNLLAMAALLAGNDDMPSYRGKVDLIYIDPPFDSKADYRTKITLPGGDLEQKPTVLEQFAYSDTWKDGTASYLQMIVPRLVLLRELLSDEGSIYVHIDWHVGHYVKVVMDEIFGKDLFINDIIWKRGTPRGNASGHFPHSTDNLLLYAKTQDYYFESVYTEHKEGYIEKYYNYFDEKLKKYFQPTSLLGHSGINPEYEWRGITKPWRYPKHRLDQLDQEGRIYWPKESGMPRYKRYVDETKGRPVQSLWEDIPPVNSQASDKLNYDTQKPEALIQRILEASTQQDSIIADFFSGSGTAAAVAERLGRKWIASDLGKPACMITRKRLIDQDAKPFLYQHVGDYQVEMARSAYGRKFRIGDLADIVLGLFGALPLPLEENPTRSLGRIPRTKTLVMVDSPNKMTGLATLRKALSLRDNHMGGWDKVVVLGWNFDPSIGHDIQGLNEGEKLEVLVIPPDLFDRIKKKGTKLKAEEVRFSSLQYLVLGDVKRGRNGDKETLTVPLDNYVLLSPEALNLDEASRAKVQDIINKDPLALVEYWSIDPDYDGEIFRSVWQDYRGNRDNDDDPLRVTTVALLSGLPVKKGTRRVCVRAVDVFGFEAEAIVEVAG